MTAHPAIKAGMVSISDNNKGKFQGLITPIKENGSKLCSISKEESEEIFLSVKAMNSLELLLQRSIDEAKKSTSNTLSHFLPVSVHSASMSSS